MGKKYVVEEIDDEPSNLPGCAGKVFGALLVLLALILCCRLYG